MSPPARERSAGKKRRVAPVSSDVSTELATCVELVVEAARFDLLLDLMMGLREILHHPAPLIADPLYDWLVDGVTAAEPSREDPE